MAFKKECSCLTGDANGGVRPALNLKADTLVKVKSISGLETEDGGFISIPCPRACSC